VAMGPYGRLLKFLLTSGQVFLSTYCGGQALGIPWEEAELLVSKGGLTC
jgi:hypothetical protein